jgi:hypothetical protein
MYSAQITVSDSADTAVVTNSVCGKVNVYEDPGVSGWPNSDYLVRSPDESVYVRKAAGTSFEFKSGSEPYKKGETLGYVKMVTGTTTFDQFEESA